MLSHFLFYFGSSLFPWLFSPVSCYLALFTPIINRQLLASQTYHLMFVLIHFMDFLFSGFLLWVSFVYVYLQLLLFDKKRETKVPKELWTAHTVPAARWLALISFLCNHTNISSVALFKDSWCSVKASYFFLGLSYCSFAWIRGAPLSYTGPLSSQQIISVQLHEPACQRRRLHVCLYQLITAVNGPTDEDKVSFETLEELQWFITVLSAETLNHICAFVCAAAC